MSERLDRARLYHEAIHEILLREWDPIGVAGEPGAQDEYDSYIPAIYLLMQARSSVMELASHLGKLETVSMGLLERPAVNNRVAQMLSDHMA